MIAELVSAGIVAAGMPGGGQLAVKLPHVGERYGRVSIPALHVRSPIIQGAARAQLDRGVGHLVNTYLPGMGGSIALFGHRTTHAHPFLKIDRLEKGQEIVVDVPYGRYVYRVRRHRVIAASDWSLIRPRLGREVLLIAACHPPGSAAYRYVVVATPA